MSNNTNAARLIASILILMLFVAGCSADPADSDEYRVLEQQLATAKQQLADITAERDSLVAELDAADTFGSVDGALPAEAVAVIDGYNAAVLAADGEAMLQYVTDDFAFLSYGVNVQERDFRASYVTDNYTNFSVEMIGEPMVVGDGDTLIVAVPERATTPLIAEGFSTMRLVKLNGEWLIDVHRFTGQ